MQQNKSNYLDYEAAAVDAVSRGSFLSWIRMDVMRLVSLKSSTTSVCVSTRLTTRSQGFSLSSSPSSCSRNTCGLKLNRQ